MTIKRIKLGVTAMSMEEKLSLTSTVITKLTGNLNFTTPNPTLAILGAKRQAVVDKLAAIGAAEAGLRQLIEERMTVESDLDAALIQEAAYVQTTSGGDATKILGSGFLLRASGLPIGPLPAPQNLHSNGGDLEGTVECQWDPVHGARSYIAECGATPTGPWTQIYAASRAHCEAGGLAPGQQYWFRVCAVGPLGQGPWSDPSTKRAS